MTVMEAWHILGFDFRAIHDRLASRPKSERSAQAESDLEMARKEAKIRMRDAHPDRPAGDMAKFKEIGAAIELIETATGEFCKQLAASIADEENKRETKRRNAVFIKLGS